MRVPSWRVAGVVAAIGPLVLAAPATTAHAATHRAVSVSVSVGCHDNEGLYAAVDQANAAGSGTIRLARHCAYTLTAVHPGDYGDNALPRVTGRVTITGNGSVLARADTAPRMRILQVAAGGALTVRDTTLANGELDPTFSFGGDAYVSPGGALTLEHCRVRSGAARWGGGVLNDGPLTVVASQVAGNTAFRQGGGIWNRWTLSLTASRVTGNTGREGFGGIVSGGETPGPTATATVRFSTVSNNRGGGVGNDTIGILHLIGSVVEDNPGSATDPGAGIYNEGVATLTASRVSGNHSPLSGGGIYNRGGQMSLDGTTVSGNAADTDAGGIWNAGGTVRATRSLVVGNLARRGRGGGIHNGSAGSPATTRLDHTVVTLNTAGRGGGGIFNANGDVVLRASEVVANRPDNVAPRPRPIRFG